MTTNARSATSVSVLHSGAMKRAAGNRRFRLRRGLATLALAFSVLACEPPGIGLDPERARTEIESFFGDYLPRLGAAYAQMDPALLGDLAAEKERATLQRLVDEMAARGERLEPELLQFTVEDVTVVRSSAYVITIEVWDIELKALGSETVLGSYPGTRYTVRYQMKWDARGWHVLFRTLEETPDAG